MIKSINGEKVKVFKGYKMDSEEILVTDSTLLGKEEVVVIIEPSYLRFLFEERGLLEELGINATIW